MPEKQSRRKRFTPQAKSGADDAWQRTLDIMGLEPLSGNQEQTTIANGMSSPAPEASLAQGSEKKTEISILDLPSETQNEIFKHSSTNDLIALSLVSKHFRAIAAEQLYRSFHIVFPDDEDPSNESPVDGLASGLDTLVTSDYDYAQHLREIILEPLSGGTKGERAYRQYRYDVSCGKFLNTLILLTLRKAKALETFRWNIRVELSREVFKVLHRVRSLQHLSVRFQMGPSLFQAPPLINTVEPVDVSFPLVYPLGNQFTLGSTASKQAYQKSLKSILPAVKRVPPTLSGFKNLKTLEILDMDTLDYESEVNTCIGNSSSTLSSLKISFSEELATKSRKPPPEIVSDDESDQEDEFGQGILPPGPPPGPVPSGAADPNGPTKVLKALEEKKKQEVFLARIFGMEKEDKEETLEVTSTSIAVNTTDSQGAVEDPIHLDELRARFLRTLGPITLKLFADSKSRENLSPDEGEILNIITRFETVMGAIQKTNKESQSQPQARSDGGSTAKATPASSSASTDERAESDPSVPAAGDEKGLFDEETTKKKKSNDGSDVSNPDDINVEEPEPESQELFTESDPTSLEASTDPSGQKAEEISGSEVGIGSDSAVKEAPTVPAESAIPEAKKEISNLPMDSVDLANQVQALESHLAIHSTTREILSEAQKLKERMEGVKADILAGKPVEHDVYQDVLAAEQAYNKYNVRLDEVTRDLQNLGCQMDQLTNIRRAAVTERSSEMSDYIRNTRGLTLTTLSIYLVPIKASVLSRAIDLRVLSSVTFLNVGHQTPFWNVMSRENKLAPLPLHKIFTDNVTIPFLVFLSQLDKVTELLLLERTQKPRVESTTAKTTVTIEQIRRVILKKHAASLKILMLRNEASIEWDMNAKTAMLLCHRAKRLEELAVSFGVKTMHTFLQFMPGLTSLRAFHTIQFRTDDTCMWVCREFRKFTVDNIAHNPDMKLEWIALDGAVERLVRRFPVSKSKVDKKGKGTEITRGADTSKKTFAQLVLGSGGVWPDGTSMSANLVATMGSGGLGSINFLEDSDDDEDGAEWGNAISEKVGLKVETVEGMRFCDVTGVRIFEKDVLGGRL